MVFCIGYATLKYEEGLAAVGIEGETMSCFSSVVCIYRLARDCRAESGRILDTYPPENATRPDRSVQHQLGARNVPLFHSFVMEMA